MSEEMNLPYHRKHRPNCMNDYAGNTRLKKGAMAALKSKVKPQVIMFNGTSGGGKTTFARLLAKEYLCENRDDEKGACGECYNCKRMEEYIETGDAGMLMNLKEVDITDARGVDAISEIIEDMEAPSFDGSWKIFILDECHVMSPAAQNRLLKPIEEPAEKVLILLCTTDPEKLLPTIISRCQYIFKVEKPKRDEMCEFLAKICKKEGLSDSDIDGRALSLISVKGDFAFRKTLIELERVVREHGKVTYKETCEILDTIEDEMFFKFFDIVNEKPINIVKYMNFLGKIKESNMEFKDFVDGLVSFTTRGLYVHNGVIVDALDMREVRRYSDVFKAYKPEDLAFMIDTLLNMKSSLDVETRLLLLGYTGFYKPVYNTNNSEDVYVDTKENTASTEKRAGEVAFLESVTMTEEEKQKVFTEQSKQVKSEDLAKLFGGVLVDRPSLN